MSLLQNSNAIETGGYPIQNSLRFQSASSTYLTRTPSTASNRKTWTWSAWVKRGTLGATESKLFGASASTTPTYIMFSDNVADALTFAKWNGSSHDFRLTTTQVFRDPSAWYHIVIALDTTQATNTNRIKIYVNGTQVTAFGTSTYPSLNYDADVSNNVAHYLGLTSSNTSNPFDGYMTEVNFIDGQALTPSSFGETNTLTGQWVAKKYNGTYGTNGFYLPFSNGTSTTTLGADSSGNGNNWTLNNFTRSVGVSDCWMIDVPSGNSSTGGNYATLNPLNSFSSAVAPSAANLQYTGNTSAWRSSSSTISMSSGKWYAEFSCSFIAAGSGMSPGIVPSTTSFLNNTNNANGSGYGYFNDGNTYAFGTATASGTTYATNDVIGIAFDATNGKIWFSKNGVWIASGDPANGTNPRYSGITGEWCFAQGSFASAASTAYVNFGQRSFVYTPPSGFKALCTANLPASTIVKGNQFMDATTYTGNGTTNRAVVNSGAMQPDFVWVKDRSNIANHILVDAVRGVTSVLYSNTTLAQQTGTAIASLNSNGFSVNEPNTGADSSNINGRSYVGWQWNAGGSTVTNTNGSISSQVRANPTAGVSVVTYTGNGTTGATIGHGLGVAPKMMIVKNRVSAQNWTVYHESVGNTKFLRLNTTDTALTASTVWDNTSPTSSVFTLGTTAAVNGTGNDIVTYCFAEIAGFSKFGSYTGNGSTDGTFVYTGFRPKYVMIKRSDSTASWYVYDSVRSTYNAIALSLFPNLSNAEETGVNELDFLSNGFKMRDTSVNRNANGGTYIYACFAESPFANSNSR